MFLLRVGCQEPRIIGNNSPPFGFFFSGRFAILAAAGILHSTVSASPFSAIPPPHFFYSSPHTKALPGISRTEICAEERRQNRPSRKKAPARCFPDRGVYAEKQSAEPALPQKNSAGGFWTEAHTRKGDRRNRPSRKKASARGFPDRGMRGKATGGIGRYARRPPACYSMAKVETIVCFSSTWFGLLTVMPNSPAGLSISVSR